MTGTDCRGWCKYKYQMTMTTTAPFTLGKSAVIFNNVLIEIEYDNLYSVHGEVYSIQHYLIKFVSNLATGWWFSPGTPISSTNKTDRHNITEILLKVALNTITSSLLICIWKVKFIILIIPWIINVRVHRVISKESGICNNHCWINYILGMIIKRELILKVFTSSCL